MLRFFFEQRLVTLVLQIIEKQSVSLKNMTSGIFHH